MRVLTGVPLAPADVAPLPDAVQLSELWAPSQPGALLLRKFNPGAERARLVAPPARDQSGC